MKKAFWTFGILAFLGTTSAMAAGGTTTPAFNWSGPYVGLTAGYMLATSQTTDYLNNGAGPLHAEGDPNPSGIFGGLYAGFNHKVSERIVLGIEGDINVGSINGTDTSIVDASGPLPSGFHHSDDIGLFGAGRVRLGLDTGSLMPYLAGGIAFAGAHANLVHNSDISNNYQTLVGWTAGAGLDYALTPHLAGRLEYRYTNYGSLNGVFQNFPTEAVQATFSSHTIQVGLAYKF